MTGRIERTPTRKVLALELVPMFFDHRAIFVLRREARTFAYAEVAGEHRAEKIDALLSRAVLADDERVAPLSRAIDLHSVGWHSPSLLARKLDSLWFGVLGHLCARHSFDFGRDDSFAVTVLALDPLTDRGVPASLVGEKFKHSPPLTSGAIDYDTIF
jgi:hypothetical protein